MITTANAKRVRVDRMDPTRTVQLRRQFLTDIRRRFAQMKRLVRELLVEQDALGLTANELTDNCGGVGGKPGPCPEMSSGEADAVYEATEQWMGPVRGRAAKALDHYIGDGHSRINSALRSGNAKERLSKSEKQMVRAMDDLAVPLQGRATLFRGVDSKTFQQVYAGLKPGQTIRDRAFTSTSFSKQTADKHAMEGGGTVEIQAEHGTHVIPAAGIGEMEMLIARGKKMKVVSIDPQARHVVLSTNCGGAGGKPGPCLSGISEVEDAHKDVLVKGLSTGLEHSVLISDNGKVLASAAGEEGTTEFPNHPDLHREGAALFVMHNHPDNFNLSPQDLTAFARYKGVDSVHAVTHDGKVHSVTIAGDKDELYKEIGKYQLTVKDLITEKLNELGDSPTPEQRASLRAERNRLLGKVAEAMAEKGLVKFSSRPVGNTVNARMCWGKPCPEGATVDSFDPVKPGIVHRIRSKVAAKYAKLEQRYGPRYAKAIIGATLASIPIPGGSVAPLLLTAIAEIHRKLKPIPAGNVWNSDVEEVKRLAAKFVQELLDEHDDEPVNPKTSPLANTRWAFMATPDQLKAFQAWLAKQLRSVVLGASEDELWKRYVKEAFEKGAGRSFDDVRQAKLRTEKPELFTPEAQDIGDFYRGTKEEFLRSAFNRPIGIEKVKVLASRTFTDLKGVTDQMAATMSRTMLDGMIQGKHSRVIAKDLANVLDMTLPKAERIARTEVSRAYVEGQLDVLESMGVERLGVMVEWSTVGDNAVCELCQPLEGVVLTIAEARGMFPRHPNCRCALIEANVGEDEEDQKRSKSKIDRAISESVEAEGGDEATMWIGADKSIAKFRPKSILNRLRTNPLLVNWRNWRPGLIVHCGGKGGKPGPCPEIGQEATYAGRAVKVVSYASKNFAIVIYKDTGLAEKVHVSGFGDKPSPNKPAMTKQPAEQLKPEPTESKPTESKPTEQLKPAEPKPEPAEQPKPESAESKPKLAETSFSQEGYDKWKSGLDATQKNAFKYWGGGAFPEIKQAIANPGEPIKNGIGMPHEDQDKYRQVAEAFSKALETAPKKPGTYFRGMHNISQDQIAAMSQPGHIMDFKAPASFSEDSSVGERFAARDMSPSSGRNFVVLKVSAPMVPISPLVHIKREAEFIPTPSTKYRVVKSEPTTSKNKNGATIYGHIIHLEPV